MSPTDTSERGLESLIVAQLTGGGSGARSGRVSEKRAGYGGGYVLGNSRDYDRDHAVDVARLLEFLRGTQPAVVEQLGLENDGPQRRKFLHRLQGEVARRGVVDVLRKGVKHGPAQVDLFYGTPSPGNREAAALNAANVFSVTRQLRYSKDETRRALDLALFINGLPVATFELKNSLTVQTVADAVEQYKRDRDPRELLFKFGRCLAHFAVDDQEVRFCTELKGRETWFLPFNRGYEDGAGNPPNPEGLKTDYLWKEVLTREGLTDIIENFAQVVKERDDRTGRIRERQIFPRYHQLGVVHYLLDRAASDGVGHRYLVQHSAGSGKSNSIAWLAHQLVGLEAGGRTVFDSVVVITDRRILDKQIRDTIKDFAQVRSVMGHAETGAQLGRMIADGKKIIVTTLQRFPFTGFLDEIGGAHRNRRFAIIIDEAHSSQGGRTAAQMNVALSEHGAEDEETLEDRINRVMEARKMLPNASYFAFTATPKNKTLEVFGQEYVDGGETKPRAHHTYTMKQAIQEGFILDVLANYTPVRSYYRLAKRVQEDPEFDTKRAQQKLRQYVEGHEYAVRQKAEIMVDHFHEHVLARRKIGGNARAMVVTASIERAIRYHEAIRAYLRERKSPFRAIVAFSGEHEWRGRKETEATLNGFPSREIEERFREDPYRFLVVANKFQTGYDEPLLHTMYVDKVLSDVHAVQTLSRLNRAHPQKHDTFVLDFANDAETIRAAFEEYYRTTILAEKTDPNRLHDLKRDLDAHQVYSREEVDVVVERYLSGAERDRLDPVLDACVAAYNDVDEDGKAKFKKDAKKFVRAYEFLASVLPYSHAEWEKLSIFLRLLVPKLPAPRDEDVSEGILQSVDMDSYRIEAQAAVAIALADADAEIDPVPLSGGGTHPEPEIDLLSNIIRAFNDQFGNIEWNDADRIRKTITEEIPGEVRADTAYQNAIRNSDRQAARLEHDRALNKVMNAFLSRETGDFSDFMQFYKLYSDNESFRRFIQENNFEATYNPEDEAA